MFSARRELFEARIDNARLQLTVEALQREAEGLRTVMRQLTDANAAQNAELTATRERAHEAEKRAEVFKDRLDLVANHIPQASSGQPLGMSEATEDLEYAFESGLINKAEFEAELEAAGMLNPEIELVPGPRL